MSPGGGGVDIDIVVNSASALKIFKDLQRAADEMAKGVEGSVGRWESAVDHAAKFSTSVINRTQQAQERYIKSIESTAAAYGKTGVEKLITQRDQIIKRLGDEEKAVARVTAAYAKMIQVEQGKGGAGGGYGNLTTIARGARDIFEGRMAYGEIQLGKAALAYGAFAVAGTAAIGVLAGLEITGYKSAKAIGEYGMRVHDMQIKTGMSAVEVQRLDFAAKLTGQDISVMDRVMRGLTQAIEGTDAKAQSARETLRGMGVDTMALRTGLMSPMEVLQKVSSALETQPNLWMRNREAIELFNRAGIQSLPMLTELNQSLRQSNGLNFISESEIKRFRQIHTELEQVSTEWDLFMLRVKSGLAKPFLLTLQIAKPIAESITDPSGFIAGMVGRTLNYAYGDRSALPDADAVRNQPMATGLSIHTPTPAERYGRSLIGSDIEATQREAQRLRRSYDEMLTSGMVKSPGQDERIATVSDIRAAASAYSRMEASAKALEKSETNRLANLEAIRKLTIDVAERSAHPFGMLQAESELKSILERPGITSSQVQTARKLLEPQIAQQRQNREDLFQRARTTQEITESRELTRIRLSAPSELGIHELNKDGVTAAQIEASLTEQYKARIAASRQERMDEVADITRQKVDVRDIEGIHTQVLYLLKAYGVERVSNARAAADLERQIADLHTRDQEETAQFNRSMSKIKEGDRAEEIRHTADLRAKYAELGFRGDNPAAGINMARGIRKQEALDLYNAESERIKLEEKGHQAELANARNLRALHDADNKAQEEAQVKLFEMQQRQLDEIKGKTKSLLETLFTHPSQFGSRLGTTLRDAALSPVINGISERFAQAVYPTVYGPGGTTGIAGSLRQMFSGTRGTSDATNAGWSGTNGGGGYAFPPTPPPTVDEMLAGIGGGGNGAGTYSASDLALGGTPPFIGGGGTVGGSGGGFGGFRPNLSSLRQIGKNLGGFIGLGNVSTDSQGGKWAQVGNQSIPLDSIGGYAKAISRSPAFGAAGTALAMHGLLGESRGTWSGTIQGAAGGAMIGQEYGGPMGAAIGAAAGFFIGVGEQIAGVESPRRQAIRLIRDQYHISISNSMADQVVNIAKERYGSTLSLAVRSPEVRQMLGLYAAGTGQAALFQQSNSTPHGGSLIESGGSLYTQRSYQYGNPLAYSSNLPIYGGGGGGSYSSGGGGGTTQIALSISGSAVAPFMQNQFVTPDFVSNQYSAALNASAHRLQQSMLIQEPGSTV